MQWSILEILINHSELYLELGYLPQNHPILTTRVCWGVLIPLLHALVCVLSQLYPLFVTCVYALWSTAIELPLTANPSNNQSVGHDFSINVLY